MRVLKVRTVSFVRTYNINTARATSIADRVRRDRLCLFRPDMFASNNVWIDNLWHSVIQGFSLEIQFLLHPSFLHQPALTMDSPEPKSFTTTESFSNFSKTTTMSLGWLPDLILVGISPQVSKKLILIDRGYFSILL